MDNLKLLILTIVVAPIVVGVILHLIGLFLEYRTGWFAKSPSSSRNKSVMTLRQRVANVLRFKPRLTISVKDINCHAIKLHEATRGTYKGQVWVWEFICLVEIKNKGKATATQISTGEIKLSLKCKDNVFTLEIAPGTARGRFDLEKGQSTIRRIVFPREDVVKEHAEFYPNGSYRLEYIHTFAGFRTQKAVTEGKLAKADWSEDARSLLLHDCFQ